MAVLLYQMLLQEFQLHHLQVTHLHIPLRGFQPVPEHLLLPAMLPISMAQMIKTRRMMQAAKLLMFLLQLNSVLLCLKSSPVQPALPVFPVTSISTM